MEFRVGTPPVSGRLTTNLTSRRDVHRLLGTGPELLALADQFSESGFFNRAFHYLPLGSSSRFFGLLTHLRSSSITGMAA